MNAPQLQAVVTDIGSTELLTPESRCWDSCGETRLELTATPLDRQPSAYVQKSWQGRQHGQTPSVAVRVLRNADSLAIRLSWPQARPSHGIDDVNAYADACAVLFPADGRSANLDTMGSETAPVLGWHWRAGADHPFSISASGIGTVAREKEHQLRASGRHAGGQWQVVLLHPLKDARPTLVGAVQIAVAIWNGSAGERAGLKSHTPKFHELRL